MGLIRLLIYAALIYLLVRLFKGLTSKPKLQGDRPPPEGKLEGGELVQDPKCGVYIPKETALRGPGGDYFCSVECRDAYGQRES